MMAHLIKLFNCSGNHYHHHRCSIIHHFWRALLTSGAHSPALLKPGQISPTPLGVSVGCNLSPVESCPKAYSEGGGGTGKQTNKQTCLPTLSPTPPTPRHYIILLAPSLHHLPGSRVKARRRGDATFYSPEWVQSWKRGRLLRNSLLSILWAGGP